MSVVQDADFWSQFCYPLSQDIATTTSSDIDPQYQQQQLNVHSITLQLLSMELYNTERKSEALETALEKLEEEGRVIKVTSVILSVNVLIANMSFKQYH